MPGIPAKVRRKLKGTDGGDRQMANILAAAPTEGLPAAMADRKPVGMRAAYDELMATAVRRQHDPRRVVGDLLAAGINEKNAQSLKCQITVAKLPVARRTGAVTFGGTPVNGTPVRDLARGAFLNRQRNLVVAAGLARARPTSPSASRALSSATGPGAASLTLSTRSTSWRLTPAPGAPGAWPDT